MTVTIRLRGKHADKVVVVNDEDAHLAGRPWHGMEIKGKGLVYAKGYNVATGKVELLHHAVIGKRDGLIVDHIDGDPLNNTRANLRHTTYSQNNINTAKWRAEAQKWLDRARAIDPRRDNARTENGEKCTPERSGV